MPPAVPSGLKAVVDSNGVVTLTWNKNSERDLMGYKIYRAMKIEGGTCAAYGFSVGMVINSGIN